jgi:hypothetical protein
MQAQGCVQFIHCCLFLAQVDTSVVGKSPWNSGVRCRCQKRVCISPEAFSTVKPWISSPWNSPKGANGLLLKILLLCVNEKRVLSSLMDSPALPSLDRYHCGERELKLAASGLSHVLYKGKENCFTFKNGPTPSHSINILKYCWAWLICIETSQFRG